MIKRIISLFLVIFITIFSITIANAVNIQDKDLDYPYRAQGGRFDGCIVRAENGIEFSDASSNFNSKTLTVYSRPYAIEEGVTENGVHGGPEVPLFKVDDAYKALCSANIKTYFDKVGEEMSKGPDYQYESYEYYYSASNDNISVSSVGSRMMVRTRTAPHDETMSIYENGDLTGHKYIKAALEMAGYTDYSYTKTDCYRYDNEGGEYYIYGAGAKSPQPYGAVIKFETDKTKPDVCEITIEFQKDGYAGYEAGEYKAISYKDAFLRLKNNDYRSIHYDDDLTDISENDVLCELVYTDAIDLHYMMPVYKFYVRVKDESWLTQEMVGEDEEMYFFYYVPAVDMKAENPQTSDMPVGSAILLGAASLSGFVAAFYCNKRKKMKKISKYT